MQLIKVDRLGKETLVLRNSSATKLVKLMDQYNSDRVGDDVEFMLVPDDRQLKD